MGAGLNRFQHKTKIGPVPMWMILRLSRGSITPRCARPSIARSQARATAKVMTVATMSWVKRLAKYGSSHMPASTWKL